MKHFRHGDVLLTKIDSMPEGAEIAHKGEYILAYGEVTGHAHRLRVQNPSNLKVLKKDGQVYVCLMEIGTLTHEEHHKLEIVPATYKMTIEREIDPFLDEIRVVVD